MIAAGSHLYPGPDGWRCSLPGDRFIRLKGPDHLMRPLQAVLHGASTLDDVVVADTDPATVDQLLEACRERGLIQQSQRPAPRAIAVHVDGNNSIAECVVALLRGVDAVEVACGSTTEAVARDCDVLVSCAGWLPDRSWREVDSWCRTHGTAWHRCHAEGTTFVVGPLAIPRHNACYEDVRGRRLAASGLADELLAHWAYLDRGDHLPPVPWPSRPGAAIIAGLIVRDIERFQMAQHSAGSDQAAISYQLVVDLDDFEIARHPVLPLPVFGRREAAPS